MKENYKYLVSVLIFQYGLIATIFLLGDSIFSWFFGVLLFWPLILAFSILVLIYTIKTLRHTFGLQKYSIWALFLFWVQLISAISILYNI